MRWDRYKLAAVVVGLVVWVLVVFAVRAAVAAPTSPPAPVPRHTPAVSSALQALGRLAEFGYTINTPARADRAIRHWQRANGLTVDGIVGPQTLASLDMTATATATVPAARLGKPTPVPAATPEQIIREIWPDDIEDRAVQIAHRESRLVPEARNACCYGLFQIYYAVHRGWLADIGVTSPAELLDARTNATAAYALYQRNGWAPWSL